MQQLIRMPSREAARAAIALVGVVVGLGLLLGLSGGPAHATNFADRDADCQTVPCRANNEYHWFAYACTAGSDIVEGFERTRQWDYEPNTTLVTSEHGTCVSDSTDWDIYAEKCYDCVDGPGIALCYWTTSGSTYEYCNHSHVVFNGSFTDAYDANQMQELACHEVGHTVGLEHGSYSPWSEAEWACMVNEVPVDGAGDSRWLRNHNEGHINGWY